MDRLLNKIYFIDNLCFLHGLMIASAPLLRFAISRSQGDLREYYKKHLAEELAHDDLLRKDLQKFGINQIPKTMCAAEIAGAQYYMIDIVSPACLLGYMYFLESRAPTPEIVDALESHYGLTLECLRLHSQNDPWHVKEITEQIEKLPKKQKAKAVNNAHTTSVVMAAVTEQLWQNAIAKDVKYA